MPEYKKNHYVPVFYLKRFSEDEKRICLYNLRRALMVPTATIKDECYENYFYGKDNDIESTLTALEDFMLEVLSIIDKTSSLPPKYSSYHITLIVFILTQLSRTKYTADMYDELHDGIFKETFKEKLEADLKNLKLDTVPDDLIKEMTKDISKEELETELKNINLDNYKIGFENPSIFSLGIYVPNFPLILDLDYKLLINKTDEEFITSDHPVVLYNQFLSFMKSGSNTGLTQKGLKIFFPISPDKMIILYDSSVYRVGSKKKNVIEINNNKDVYELNTLQACSCNDNIYFRNKKLNVKKLHRKVKPYLRKKKSKISIISSLRTKNRKEELIATSTEDINTDINVSFLSTRRSAKTWRTDFKKKKFKPPVITRNQKLFDDLEKFKKSKEFHAGEFDKFINNQFGRDKD